jgi:tellurite resistance protein TerC
MKHFVFRTISQARRLIVIATGFTVLVVGVAMIVLPGPAVIVIPIGLAILATEFVWAKKLLQSVKERFERMKSSNGNRKNK